MPNRVDGEVGEKPAPLQVSMLLEQLAHRGRDFRFGDCEVCQPALTRIGLQIAGLVEVGRNAVPLPRRGRC